MRCWSEWVAAASRVWPDWLPSSPIWRFSRSPWEKATVSPTWRFEQDYTAETYHTAEYIHLNYSIRLILSVVKFLTSRWGFKFKHGGESEWNVDLIPSVCEHSNGNPRSILTGIQVSGMYDCKITKCLALSQPNLIMCVTLPLHLSLCPCHPDWPGIPLHQSWREEYWHRVPNDWRPSGRREVPRSGQRSVGIG